MRSQINWSLLGLVIQRPSYGYELVNRFERTYGETLQLSSVSHIYAGLDALVQRGLVEKLAGDEPEPGGRQPRTHYRATTQGEDAYEQWLVYQLQQERTRSRLFAQQLAMLDVEPALRVLERYEQACLKRASAVPVDATSDEAPSDDTGRLAARLVSEEDRVVIAAKLVWIGYARDELLALAAKRSDAG